MGRDWLYWALGGASRPSAAKRTTRRSRDADAGGGGGAATSAGCMCAVFQLFDLNHHHPFNFHHANNHFLQEQAIITSKGVEAPRNSLELNEPSLTKEGGIQIKTRISNAAASKSRTEDIIPSIDSPSAKTPSLVARLMGLDLLPDQQFSTSPSNSNNPNRKDVRKNVVLLRTRSSNNNSRYFSDDDITVGARSLPETPRISSARRSDSEYQIRSRHSLQISNKENTCHQIVKQVKERVGRRVIGLNDITNRDHEMMVRRDQNLVLLKPTKQGRALEISTKVGFSDTKKNKQRVTRTTSSSSDGDYQGGVILNAMKPKKNQSVIQENRRGLQENCGKKVNMMMIIETNKKNKNKKKETPLLLASEKLNISGPILYLPVKKDPSPPATKLPQKQSQVSDALSSKRNTQQLSSKPSRSYTHLHLQPSSQISTVVPDNPNGCATAISAAAAAAEYNTYVQKILKRTGINDNITPLALGKWHTPSHPLDPSIYYHLELFHPSAAANGGALSRRCNRKLIFQLVDELLAEILRPHLDFKPWVVSPPPINGDDRPGLIDEICEKIGNFPAANCVVLEDIDSLIESDLCNKWGWNGFFEDGGERIVCEIEGEIVEELVRETVAAMVGGPYGGGAEQRQERIMSRGGLLIT